MIAIGCENISLSFGGETVLDGVGFSLGEGVGSASSESTARERQVCCAS